MQFRLGKNDNCEISERRGGEEDSLREEEDRSGMLRKRTCVVQPLFWRLDFYFKVN